MGRLFFVTSLNWKLAKKSHRLMNRDEFEGELKEGCYITVTDEVIRILLNAE